MKDFQLAIRSLRKTPGFTVVAVLTLALGIGATTAMFSVVDAVLLRPVPFPDVDRLLMIWETDRASDTSHEPSSFPDFLDFRLRSRRISEFGAFTASEVSLATDRGEPSRVAALFVTDRLFAVLGIAPVAGRTFTAAEDQPGGGTPIVISSDLWQRQFDRDPRIVGRSLRLNDRVRTIVGVVPSTADFGIRQVLSAADYGRGFAESDARGVDVFVPLQADSKRFPRSTHPILVVGRLAPGATVQAAQEELSLIAADLEKTYPENEARGVLVQPIRDVVLGPVEPPLLILFSAVTLVLLIACANVAHLLLIRGASRAREIAVKRALGIGRGALVRQFLAESAVLVTLSAITGLWLAIAAQRLVVLGAPVDIPRLVTATIDLRVLAVTMIVSAVVAVVFGLLPLLQLRRHDVLAALGADGTRAMTGGRERAFIRSVLVAGEIALAVVLIVGAGLLVKSFWRLQRVNPGFEQAGVVKAEFQLPSSRYPKGQDVQRFNDALLAGVLALPGVASAGIAAEQPLAAGFTNSFTVVGREAEASDWPEISTRRATPGYFRALRIPLVRGRLFADSDNASAAPVVLINEEAARRFFSRQDPIGQRMAFWGERRTIVGIVGNEKIHGLRQPAPIAVYLPLAQAVTAGGVLLVRASGASETVVAAVRAALREVEPGVAVFGIEALEGTLARSVGEERFTMQLIAAFALLALTLAIVGVHSVQSYVVAQRTREIGIRVALGASSERVTRMVFRQGVTIAVIGLGVGMFLAMLFAHALSGLLFGVTSADPGTFLVGLLFLGTVAMLATWLPARRASRVDPIVALRSE
jgi:putative ABC transport system permease protein